MLSHLRFHRRAPSNPTSPLPDQLPPWESTTQDHAPPPAVHDAPPRPQSSSAQMAPVLPPIARVTSAGSEHPVSFDSRDDERPMSQDSRGAGPPSFTRGGNNGAGPGERGGTSSFIGGVALQNYRRNAQAGTGAPETAWGTTGRPGSAGNASLPFPESHLSRVKPPPPPINTNLARPGGPAPVQVRPVPSQQTKVSSFVTPTDLQQYTSGATGKRPAGTRLATEPAPSQASTSVATSDQQSRGRKGFLKNPMSTLLMRRKNGQNVPDNMMLSLHEQPVYQGIKGTRVHDFSAPRPKRTVPVTDANVAKTVSSNVLGPPPVVAPPVNEPFVSESEKISVKSSTANAVAGAVSEPVQASRITEPAAEPNQEALSRSSSQPKSEVIPDRTTKRTSRRMSREKPLPEYPGDRAPPPSVHPVPPVPPVPPKDDVTPLRSFPSMASRAISVDTTALLKSDSTRTTVSRKTSVMSQVSRRESIISALPKHMKSTSSRFSFDMIGAAKQEKLLEERHRQREMEKKTTAPTNMGSSQRDSRFDDFDEDGFDYDAMMEDDGLEEAIPGVNVELDEDDFEGNLDNLEEELEEVLEDYDAEMDPDNDQENFAGFVFQRSNPNSALTSPNTPGMLVTPRDAHGKVIGFAVTKDTTPDLGPAASPIELKSPIIPQKAEPTITGLGIQGMGMETQAPAAYNVTSFQENRNIHIGGDSQLKPSREELYFDDGLADELDFEHQGPGFDESLLDLDDTDQYGRPIPGAFAEAQRQFAAQQQETSRRASDMTSRLSAQSQLSQSTAHTSMSIGLQAPIPEKDTRDIDHTDGSVSPAQGSIHAALPGAVPAAMSGTEFAYQAALAEAAQQAAASGKFRRSSSPPLPEGLTITSPTDSAKSQTHSHPELDTRLEDYEDDPYSYGMDDYGMDDYEFDDDAIIAEANASALANDSDGFYGQEFGFYAAAPQQSSHHGHSSSSNSSSKNKQALSTENLYQYASGGFFGPSGGALSHSASGRLVSREPNLTPITERSEYSNRNSIMSMGLPPAIGSAGGPGSEGRNSGIIQSPGLAQLAMMADENDPNMSLSALLKLRSRAWGGSQASLVSSREGSPRSERGASSPWGPGSGYLGPMGGVGGNGVGHVRKNSAFSLWSNSDAGSGSGSPTLTMGMSLPLSSPPVPVPALPANLAAINGNTVASPGSGIPPPPMFSPPPPPVQNGQSPTPGQLARSCPPVPEDDEVTVGDDYDDSDSDRGTAATTTATTSALTSAVTEQSESSLSGSAFLARSPVTDDGSAESTPTSPYQVQHQLYQKAGITGTMSPPSRRSGMGHRHQGSAESISYMIDGEKGSGETRWVMERRRTAESGEVEILGREVIEGGRI